MTAKPEKPPLKRATRLTRFQYEIERHRNVIAKERDALRALQSDIEDLLEPTDRGVEALDEAITAFSEQA